MRFRTEKQSKKRDLLGTKAIHVFVLAILALCLTVTSSVAWLTMNQKTSYNEIGMGLNVDDTSASYVVYKYNLNTDKGVNADANGTPLTITTIEMNEYDMIFTKRNRNTPLIAEIEITRQNKMPLSGAVTITITRERGANESVDGSELSAYSSSIARFTGILGEEEWINIDGTTEAGADELYKALNNDEMYEELGAYTQQFDHSKTFTTYTYSGTEDNRVYTYSKTNEIVVSLAYDEGDWLTIDGRQRLYLYLYISYDIDLINRYLDDNDMDPDAHISFEENTVEFINDLVSLRVGYES